MKQSEKRKIVQVGSERLDVHELLDNCTLDEAIEKFEQLRVNMSDYSFLCNFDVRLHTHWDDMVITVTRPETDEEYNKRQARNKKISESRRNKNAQLKAKEAKKELKRREAEVKLYKRLKEKYGDEV